MGHDEIIAGALETIMLLGPDDKNDITRLHIRRLIALTGKSNTLVVLHTGFHNKLEDLPVRDDLLAFTLSASVLFVNDLTTASALWAVGLLGLLEEAHALGDDTDTTTVAGLALDRALATLGTVTVALGTQDVTGDGNV